MQVKLSLSCFPYADVRDSWGESAGAISVSLHMLTNGGDTGGLFHGAFMQSGAPIPVGDISRGQTEYDQLVQDTLCGDAPDTLECLRALPYDILKLAVDQSPGIISEQVSEAAFETSLSWLIIPSPSAYPGFPV